MYVLTDDKKIADKISDYFPGITIVVKENGLVNFLHFDEDAKNTDAIVMGTGQDTYYKGYHVDQVYGEYYTDCVEFLAHGKKIPFIRIDPKTLMEECPDWIPELCIIANKLGQEYIDRQTDKILGMED